MVIPVYNEEADLAACVSRLHAYLSDHFPYRFRITVADNASTDRTRKIARSLADRLPDVVAVHLDAKGRSRALRQVWQASDALVLANMDVDLFTDLAALLPLVAPLISGHSDLAIGSRLARGSRVVPLHTLLDETRAAPTHGTAKALVNGSVGSSVMGSSVVGGTPVNSATVDGAPVSLRSGRLAAQGVPTGLPWQLLSFASIGVASTVAYAVLFWLLRSGFGAQTANLVALLLTAIGNTAANRRLTFGVSGRVGATRHQLQGLFVFALGLGLTSGSLAVLHAVSSSPRRGIELSVLVLANFVATVLRFLLMRVWIFRRHRHHGR